MTIPEAFEHLLSNWRIQKKPFKDEYRSYKSKYLKSKKDMKAEKIGEKKIKEMLLNAGYIIKEDVTPP